VGGVFLHASVLFGIDVCSPFALGRVKHGIKHQRHRRGANSSHASGLRSSTDEAPQKHQRPGSTLFFQVDILNTRVAARSFHDASSACRPEPGRHGYEPPEANINCRDILPCRGEVPCNARTQYFFISAAAADADTQPTSFCAARRTLLRANACFFRGSCPPGHVRGTADTSAHSLHIDPYLHV